MKNILVLAHDDAGQPARIQAALDLVRALDGHLTCLDVTQTPLVIADYYSHAGEAMLLTDERTQEADNRTRLQAQLAAENIAWEWADVTGDIGECVVQAAELADLIVINRELRDDPLPDMRGIAGMIAMRSRKPLVAMPDDVSGFRADGRAMIAWDGSTPVAETMRACVPLLRLASSVRLFQIDDARGASAEDAAAYLSRHGIHASIRYMRDGHHRDALIRIECSTWHADWCLIGAYGHGRLRETVFGGTTRSLLGSSAVPLVLGH
jgi:nucleotide-binding universal stress UspA family protein